MLIERNFNQVFLRVINSLCNGIGNLIGLSKTVANYTIAVSHHNYCGEAEPASTFHYFGDPINSYYFLLKVRFGCPHHFVVVS